MYAVNWLSITWYFGYRPSLWTASIGVPDEYNANLDPSEKEHVLSVIDSAEIATDNTFMKFKVCVKQNNLLGYDQLKQELSVMTKIRMFPVNVTSPLAFKFEAQCTSSIMQVVISNFKTPEGKTQHNISFTVT